MGIFENRRLLVALSAFILTAVLCTAVTGTARAVLLPVFIALTVIAIAAYWILRVRNRRMDRIADLALCLFFCSLALLCAYRFFDQKYALIKEMDTPMQITAEIHSVDYTAAYLSRYTVRITEADGLTDPFQASLEFPFDAHLNVGDRITATAERGTFSGLEYGYNQERVMLSDGILALFTAESYTKTGRCDLAPWLLLHELRTAIADRIDRADYPTAAPLLKALLLGDKEDFSGRTVMQFKRLGISHLLAVSGTHFSVLLGLVAILFSLLGFPKKFICILLIPIAVSYAALTGFSPSVCRAGIMAIFCYIGFLFGRMRDTYTALFAAVVLLLILQPYLIFSVSLWLSFVSTFTILVAMELLGKRLFDRTAHPLKRLGTYILTRMLITLAINFATLPIIATVFGEISTVSPFANLIFVPLFEVFLYLAPFSVLLSGFSPIVKLTELFGGFLLHAVRNAAEPRGLLVSVRVGFIPILAAVCIAATVVLLAVRLKHKFWIAVPFCIGTVALIVGTVAFSHQQSRHTSVTYCTYTNNDSVLLVDQNQALLIDISTGAASVSYEAIYLAKMQNCTELDGYLLTHYHDRHISQFRRILENIYVRRLYLPEPKSAEDFDRAIALVEVAEEYRVPVTVIRFGVPISFATCSVTLFAPQQISRSTHDILSLEIDDGEKQVLYLGSAFSEAQNDLPCSVAEAEYILLGQHTPVSKKPFTLSTRAKLIFGNREIAGLYNPSGSESDSYLIEENGFCEILLK